MTPPSLKGKVLGGWRVEEHIGSGAQGALYFVRKPGIDGKPIRGAMKTLTLSKDVDRQQMQLIVHELDMLKAVNSPYLPKVIDSGSDAVKIRDRTLGVQFIVMEFVNGDNLEEEVRETGVLFPDDWWNLAHDVLMALSLMHEKGIVHADVKPLNVMRGARKTMLVDLGGSSLVGLADPGDAGLMTMGWAAPEQYRSDQVDPDDWGYEVDVFCAGQLLVFAATGSAPWGAFKAPRIAGNEKPNDIRRKKFEAGLSHAERIRTLAPNLTGMTDEQISFVRQMLRYSAEHRATASELLEQVRGYLPDNSERKQGVTPQPMRWTPQTTGSRPGNTSAGPPATARVRPLIATKVRPLVANWSLSILSLCLPFGAAFRYFYLDSRETWRDMSQRAEFRFVSIFAGITTGGIMIPVMLRRWWRAGAGDLYRNLGLIAWAIPALVIPIFYIIGSTEDGGTLSWWGVFIWLLWQFGLIGGSIYAGLIPAAAAETASGSRQHKRSKKRRFV